MRSLIEPHHLECPVQEASKVSSCDGGSNLCGVGVSNFIPLESIGCLAVLTRVVLLSFDQHASRTCGWGVHFSPSP
eukprot:3205025-Amphidinium_carterae.1